MFDAENETGNKKSIKKVILLNKGIFDRVKPLLNSAVWHRSNFILLYSIINAC